jgi:hypothetical protein
MKPFSIIISALIFLSACDGVSKRQMQRLGEMQADSLPGTCPNLTRDQKGNTILSWVRINNDSSYSFCYASTSDGKKFEQPVLVNTANGIHPHSENLPKIIFKPSGEIMALWGVANPNPKNKYSGLVFYSQSFDNGKSWSTAKPLTNDTSSIDQRYYDVALLPDGEVAAIWLDNRKSGKQPGSSLFFARTRGRDGFTDEQKIAESCCQCCRTDLFVDKEGGIHVLYRGIIEDSIRDMVHAVSINGGKSFSSPSRIHNDNWILKACPHTGPSMTENSQGIHFVWFTGGPNKGCFYKQSADRGNSFQKHDAISLSGSHPQITALGNDRLIIAWDETVRVNDKFGKKIGIEERSADGRALQKIFITNDSDNCTYPVVASLGEKDFLVAYSSSTNDKTFIKYQLVQ